MDLQISLDAREVLFHLNYMGFNHISKEQLKSFMIDLKKLIKYESHAQTSSSITAEMKIQQKTQNHQNIRRLFELHTETSKLKQREKIPTVAEQKNKNHPVNSKDTNKENEVIKEKPKLIRNKSSGEIILRAKDNENKQKRNENQCTRKNKKTEHSNNKENIPKSNEEVKSKMWIRPKSAQIRSHNDKKRNDPVALYHQYQKDWAKFKSNICESSRSELRWEIREKLSNHH